MLSLRHRTREVLALSMAVALIGLVEASPASAVPFGEVRTGKATYYNDVGFGACGTPINAANQMLVAVPKRYWTTANPNNDPLCGAKVQVTWGGKKITVPVRDKCMGCGPSHIDLSQPAFAKFANINQGVLQQVKWKFVR